MTDIFNMSDEEFREYENQLENEPLPEEDK